MSWEKQETADGVGIGDGEGQRKVAGGLLASIKTVEGDNGPFRVYDFVQKDGETLPVFGSAAIDRYLNFPVNVGKFVKEFRQLKATPAEIGIRRKRIRECWGPGTDTPASTVKHWSEFQDDQRAHNDRPGRRGEHPEPKKPSLPRL